MSSRIPLLARVILLSPGRIATHLERAREAGVIDVAPNLWQLSLGVLRMWHRVIWRTETIGTSPGSAVRPTRRARLLRLRALRLPALLWERAVAPLDFTGLASPPERIIRHLLAAHHDGSQFVYDLEILSCHPGALERLAAEAREVVAGRHPRTDWWRDLVVFEGYHEVLLESAERALAHGVELDDDAATDPDLSFLAAIRWCAEQPPTPRSTLAALVRGQIDFGPTRVAA